MTFSSPPCQLPDATSWLCTYAQASGSCQSSLCFLGSHRPVWELFFLPDSLQPSLSSVQLPFLSLSQQHTAPYASSHTAHHSGSFTSMWVRTEYIESSTRNRDVTFLAPAPSMVHLVNVLMKGEKSKTLANFHTISLCSVYFCCRQLKSMRLTQTRHYCSYCILDSTGDSSGLCFCTELVKGTSEKSTTGENSCPYMSGEWTRKKGSGLSEPLQVVWPAQAEVQQGQRRESNTLADLSFEGPFCFLWPPTQQCSVVVFGFPTWLLSWQELFLFFSSF